MQKYEPLKWRTDIVISIKKDISFFNKTNFLYELNCTFTNIRKSKTDEPMCTLLDFVPMRLRRVPAIKTKINYTRLLTEVNIFSEREEDFDEFWALSVKNMKTYKFVDSVTVAFTGYPYFKSAGFDFLIRSDLDVFLTPLFATWLPYNCDDFYAGNGAFSTEFNMKRLHRIAKELGISDAKINNLGFLFCYIYKTR
jgi:hypothetical protein